MVTAVIAAAGSGERLGAGDPKAFVPVAGRPMIEWSLDALGASAAVGSVIVATPPGYAHDLGGREGIRVVAGGATRAESVANALAAVTTDLVAIHDAARPLLTAQLIDDLVAALASVPEAAAVIAAGPVTDTVKRVAAEAPGRVIAETLDRSTLWGAQTPQLFRVEVLRAALEVDPALRDAATDEAMLVEATGATVLVHPVSGPNLKVTTPLDLRIAEQLLTERSGTSERVPG